MKRGAPYTEGEIKQAIQLRGEGWMWREIGEILDRPPSSIEVTVCKYKAGKWAPSRLHERSRMLDKRLELWVQQGMSTGRMAQAAALAKRTIRGRLSALGFDYETRTEIAEIRDTPPL